MITTEYVENFSDFFNEYKVHIEKHYKNFAKTFEGTDEISLDVDLFQALISSGYANIFILKYEKVFAGYISVSISPSLLFKGEIDAIVDHVYLVEDFRGKGIFKDVLKSLESELKSYGVTRLSIAFPCQESFKRLSTSLGFTPKSYIATKFLGESDGN